MGTMGLMMLSMGYLARGDQDGQGNRGEDVHGTGSSMRNNGNIDQGRNNNPEDDASARVPDSTATLEKHYT